MVDEVVEAGPELNAWISIHVFNNPSHKFDKWYWQDTQGDLFLPRPFSTDWAAAGLLVEEMRSQGWQMTLSVNGYVTEPWDCRFFHFRHPQDDAPDKRAIAHGPTMPVAVARAARAAKLKLP